MNYERLSDTLDKKILDFNLKILGLVASLVVKPLALCTEPFFRKKFGERYLTFGAFVVSLGLWILAEMMSHVGNELYPNPLRLFLYENHKYDAVQWFNTHDVSGKVAWGVGFVYGFIGVLRLLFGVMRRYKGIRWHSMSRGESVFGSENKFRDIVIACVAISVLSFVTPVIGLLFTLSQIASYYLLAKQQNSLYERYLDKSDLEIENEFLERALEKGEPPRKTCGLYCPLPWAFKGENRVRVARVIAEGAIDPGLGGDKSGETRKAVRKTPQPTQYGPGETPTSGMDDESMASMLTQSGQRWARILTSKLFVRLSVSVVVIVGIYSIGKAMFQPKRPEVRPMESTIQPIKPKSKVQIAQESQRGAALAEERRLADAKPQEELAAQRRAEAEKREAEVQLRKQQAEEEKREALKRQKQAERETAVVQLKSTLSDEMEAVARFKAECIARLDANTNKIAGLSRSSRRTLAEQNESSRQSILKALEDQELFFSRNQAAFESVYTNAAIDPRPVINRVAQFQNSKNTDNREINALLNALDAAISTAPQKSGFLIFKSTNGK